MSSTYYSDKDLSFGPSGPTWRSYRSSAYLGCFLQTDTNYVCRSVDNYVYNHYSYYKLFTYYTAGFGSRFRQVTIWYDDQLSVFCFFFFPELERVTRCWGGEAPFSGVLGIRFISVTNIFFISALDRSPVRSTDEDYSIPHPPNKRPPNWASIR